MALMPTTHIQKGRAPNGARRTWCGLESYVVILAAPPEDATCEQCKTRCEKGS